ncbi:MAG: hypothetical protein EHM64_01560 [Ignavibacteriae bacterium]|nr:MAG: hypothetical protein EHM64_01560 [Ignavibacteriota bacterium]
MKNENRIAAAGRLALLLVFMGAVYNSSFSQNTDQLVKLRLAQSFEETGEWERAAALYEDLGKIEPSNFLYLDGLQRCYAQMKEYDKAINVIRRWLIIQPGDVLKRTALGGLLFDSGNEAAADSVWKSVVADDPRNKQLYRVVVNEMMQHRLYDQCIRMYLDGRSKSGNDAAFADELGNLYTALQQYKSATKEYLRLMTSAPEQLPFVQSRLSAYTAKPEGVRAADETVREELKAVPDNITLHRLSAWLLSEERLYDRALDEVRIIDRLSKSHGNELFNFAQRLYQEHAYKTAAEAFKEIIDDHQNAQLLPSARLGYARTFEELIPPADSAASATDVMTTCRRSIQLYESIAADYENTDFASQSVYRIGVMKFERLFDLDGAFRAFNQLKEMPSTSNSSTEAVLKLGEVQIARNDLAEARKDFDRLGKSPLVMYKDQAAYKLAELNYFEAKFDSALSILKQFDSNLNTDLTNDALQLQYFIQENNTSSPQALTEFAKADLLMRQHRYSESLLQFQDVVRRFPAALLDDDAMMKIGELHLFLNHPLDAVSAFSVVADSIQMSILKDHALFRIAEIYQRVLNNTAKAVEAYEKLLAQYPNSLYVEESRRRIRILRGDAL